MHVDRLTDCHEGYETKFNATCNKNESELDTGNENTTEKIKRTRKCRVGSILNNNVADIEKEDPLYSEQSKANA